MAASGCAAADLQIEATTLRWYEASPGVYYGFCGTCGSTLFWRADAIGDWISIAAGTIDQPSGLHTSAAWWTQSAGDYHRLDPSLQSFSREPPVNT